MSAIARFQGLLNFENKTGHTEIIFGGSDFKIQVTTKKIKEINPFEKFGYAVQSFFHLKQFVKMEINKERLLVKVTDLVKELNIAKSLIRKADLTGHLQEVIELALFAKSQNIHLTVFNKWAKTGNLDHFEDLAPCFFLPSKEFLDAKKNGTLNQLIVQAERVENRIQKIFNRLELLLKNEKNTLLNMDRKGIMALPLRQEELEAVKLTIRAAYKSIEKNPRLSRMIQMEIPISKNLYVSATSSECSLQVIGYFGKYLGSGRFGVTLQRFNLLKGKFETNNQSVMKIASDEDPYGIQILQEAHILEKINPLGCFIGIQKPVKAFTTYFNQRFVIFHLGPLYQMDLEQLLRKPYFTTAFKIDATIQLLKGLVWLHSKNITHGDIKPNNIFCNFFLGELSKKQPLFFLADFGDALDHTTGSNYFQNIRTFPYRTWSDDKRILKALEEQDKIKLQIIMQKADVFAISTIICKIFINQFPYMEGSMTSDIHFFQRPDLDLNLERAGLNKKVVKMVIQGLHKKYWLRPTPEQILKKFKKL